MLLNPKTSSIQLLLICAGPQQTWCIPHSYIQIACLFGQTVQTTDVKLPITEKKENERCNIFGIFAWKMKVFLINYVSHVID